MGESGQTQLDGSQTERPSWKQSEKDAAQINPEYREQVSFHYGVKDFYGKPGSVRPDLYKEGSSIEVKNYTLTTRAGRNSLINTAVKQVNQRIEHLPEGTAQTILVDVRGQEVSEEVLREIEESILGKCNVEVIVEFVGW